jgi:hypothetical protein
MEEQMTWYLVASSIVVAPLFLLAVGHWWLQNKGVHDSAASVTRMGIFIAILAWLPPIIFLLFASFHPLNDYSTFRMGCRWLGELFALIALVCSLRGRGWMRFALAAFSAWPFLYSFLLLRANSVGH